MTDKLVELPREAKKLEQEAEVQLVEVQKLIIGTSDQYVFANDKLKLVKSRAKELNDLRLSLTRPLDESKERIMNLFRPAVDKFKTAEKMIKDAMLEYDREMEKKRAEEEEALRKAAEEERERLEKEAKKIAKNGDLDAALALRQQAGEIEDPTVEKDTPKVSGLAKRKIWKYRITNMDKLPREYMIPNHEMLSEFARETKGEADIPGVEVYYEEILQSGR